MPTVKTQHERDAIVAGEHIFLRPPARKDADEFLRLNRVSKDLHRTLVSPPRTQEQFHKYLQRSRLPNARCFMICRRGDGKIVGAINLNEIVGGIFQSAYLGYFVGQPFVRQGFMTEALQLILKYAFTRLKLHRLEANIQPANAASIALVRRAGFVREGYSRNYLKIGGRWRDHERWAITVDLWKRPKSS